MLVALDREALEAPLVEMPLPDRPMRNAPPHRVDVGQPAEIGRHLIVTLRPDGEMPVIRQHALSEDADRVASVGLDHHALEGGEVGPLAEEAHPTDGAVEHMVDESAGGIACGSGHG